MDQPEPHAARTAEDLLADFLTRQEAGEAVDLDQYCREFPHLADDLRRAHGDLFGLYAALDSIGASWAQRAELDPGKGDRGPAGALSRAVLERLSGRHLAPHRYVVEEEIARGGMGSIHRVWDETLRRRSAMKVILEERSGDDRMREQRLARFLEEAQITGQLDHPGIVPIYEMGLDGEGRVYFTMKLVQGQTLKEVFDEYTRGEGEWTRTRLVQIIVRICEAMAFAHSRGVVHRDLKPANVMVGRFGEVYVMDWGLARVLRDGGVPEREYRAESNLPTVETDRREAAASNPDSPLHTMEGDVVGTPAYMSPEQALGRSREVDERSDVYALGALLYQMLAGSMPYIPKGSSRSNREVWLDVRSGPPMPVEQLARDVPAELMAICERAMARDPVQRYPSMGELADDMRAYIEGRVVRAYETGALAQLKKWVSRNRALSAAFALSGLLLVGALGALDYVQARDNRRISAERDLALKAEGVAAEQREIAHAEAEKSWAAVDFLMRMLSSVRPEQLGVEVTVVDALRAASEMLENGEDRPPEVTATLHEILGSALDGLGDAPGAIEHFQASLDLRRALDSPDEHEIWRSMNGLGVSLRAVDHLGESERILREGLEMVNRIEGPDDLDTFKAKNNLVFTLLGLGKLDEAEQIAREALGRIRTVFGDDALETFRTWNNLATVLFQQGKPKEAGAIWSELSERAPRVLGEQSGAAISIAQNYAFYLNEVGDVLSAEGLTEDFVARTERVFGPDHQATRVARHVYATRLYLLGQFAEAEEALRAELFRTDDGDDTDVYVLQALSLLGAVLTSSEQFEEAEELLSRSLLARQDFYGDKDERVLKAKRRLGDLALASGRSEEAIGILQEVIDVRRELGAPQNVEGCLATTALAASLAEAGRPTEAISLLEPLLDRVQTLLDSDHLASLGTRLELGRCLIAADRVEEGQALLQSALQDAKRRLGDDHPLTRRLQGLLE